MLLSHTIRHSLKTPVIIPKRYSLRDRLRPVVHDQEKHQLQVKAGPLYDLVKPASANVFPRDSAGNVMLMLKLIHDNNAHKRDYRITEYFMKLQRRLENYQPLRSRDYYELRKFLKSIELDANSSSRQLLFNLMVYIIETNPKHSIHAKILLENAYGFIDQKFDDLKFFINYKLVLENLESQGYFDKMSPKEIIRIAYQPFIIPLNKSNYLQRVQSMEQVLEFIEMNSDDTFEHQNLLKMVRNDLVETLAMAIESLDFEKIDSLWEALKSKFRKIDLEEYHNLFSTALKSSEYETIIRLLEAPNFSRSLPEISSLQKVQLARLYASKGDIDGFVKTFKYSSTSTPFEKSQIVEVFYNCDLSYLDIFKLVNYLSTENEVLVTRDYEFLVKYIKEPLEKLEKLQVIDVIDAFDFKIIDDPELCANVKTLYINLYLKSITKVTNSSGVIDAYCQLPLDYANLETYQIILNSFSSDPMKHAATTTELFRFAHHYCNLKFTSQEYCILINNCISMGRNDFDLKQLVYYLYNYFTKLGTSELDSKTYEIIHLESIDSSMRDLQDNLLNRTRHSKFEEIGKVLLAHDKKVLFDPVELLDSLRSKDVLDSLEDNDIDKNVDLDEFFENLYDPVDVDYQGFYDNRDSNQLRKRHDLYLNAMEK